MKRNPNSLPPFVPVDLRAWIHGTQGERDVVGAIRLLQWLDGPSEPTPLPMIVAACHPTSERQVKRDLASAKAKGWVVGSRNAKGRLGRSATCYALAIEPMAFKVARGILEQRANLAPRSDGATGQLELTKGPNSTDQGATVAHPNIQEKDLSERLKRKTPAAAKPLGGKHPDQDAAWALMKATWKAKYPEAADLEWPAATMRGWQAAFTASLDRLGIQELDRRWSNMVNDPWTKASLRAFILDTDKWITVRKEKGQGHARSIHTPTPSNGAAPVVRLPHA